MFIQCGTESLKTQRIHNPLCLCASVYRTTKYGSVKRASMILQGSSLATFILRVCCEHGHYVGTTYLSTTFRYVTHWEPPLERPVLDLSIFAKSRH